MTDRAKKISELTAHTNAPANNLLVIVHQPGLANAETRKITLSNFFANVSSNVSITGRVSVGNTTVINSTGFWVGPSSGVQGAQGAAGAQGAQGTAGASGSNGPTGPQGDAGVNGAQGAAGAQGATGAQGNPGWSYGHPTAAANRLVLSSNSTGYIFTSYGGNNPQIFTLSGLSIAFDLTNMGAQPFVIRDNTNTNITDNLTHISSIGTITSGAGAQAQTSGILFWQVPANITGTYRYISTANSSFTGNIVIKSITSLT